MRKAIKAHKNLHIYQQKEHTPGHLQVKVHANDDLFTSAHKRCARVTNDTGYIDTGNVKITQMIHIDCN